MGPAWHGIGVNDVADKASRDKFRLIDTYLRSVSKSLTAGTSSEPGTGLPGEPYVVAAAASALLTNERILVVSAPVTKTDGGAGGNITIGVSTAAPSGGR